jgi:DNA-binding NarL/FixJ family response regulator
MRTLTKRQRQVLELVAQGFAAKEIAAQLGVSTRTVDCHKTRIHRAAGTTNAVGMLRAFYHFVPRDETSLDG